MSRKHLAERSGERALTSRGRRRAAQIRAGGIRLLRVWWLVWLWYLGSLGWFSWLVSFLWSSSLGVASHDGTNDIGIIGTLFWCFPLQYGDSQYDLQSTSAPASREAHLWFVLAIRCFVHCPLLVHRHQDLDVEVGFRRRAVLVSQEFLDLCARRVLRLIVGPMACSAAGAALELPWSGGCLGPASWRGFLGRRVLFYGECLQGTRVEGELLGKLQLRETGRMRHSSSCLWIVSGPRVLRHFGRTRKSRGSSDAWNPQNFIATPAHGLGGPS